jgi:class 3 adenylate cyclase
MTESDLVRRLTTIMDIDVVGFSTMSARDEEHALGLLNARMATAQTLVKHHRGRVFKLTGDGLLAEFASPVEAVRAGLEIQEAMRSANGTAGPNDQLVLRIGVNLGDVVESGDDLMGDAVNVAARLESIARPGGICVSAAVYEQIAGKLTLGAEDMGEQHVKNIPRPIHAYRLTLGGAPPMAAPPTPDARNRKASRLALITAGAATVAVLSIGGAWLLHEWSEPVPSTTKVAQAPAPPATPAPSSATAAPSAPAPSPAAAPAPSATPAAAPAPPLAPPLATTASIPAPPPSPASTPRVYSAADVPFVPETRRRRLEEYAQAEDAKALAINVRGWFGIATRRIDGEAARREALEACNALVEREVAVPREFDRCMLYAVGNDVVWTFRPPPMPPPPHVPAAKLSPPVPFDAAAVPLISPPARRNLSEHYALSTRHRAMVLGHNHVEWSSPSDTDADAIRRNLQSCGHLTGRPCVVYSVDDHVVVRVPQLHRVTNIFTPQDIANADTGQRAAIERYLIADDWRAIAVASNGQLGIVSGRASEAAAASEAMAACAKSGGTNCALLSVGPFVVEAR